MRFLVALLCVALVAPTVVADHPGSNAGLAAYDAAAQQLVHRIVDVDQSFAHWEEMHPDIVDRMTIGETGILGLPLYGIRVTDESIPYDDDATATGEKIRIYLDGGHHGNEFLGVDLIMYYLHGIIHDASSGECTACAEFLDTHEIYAVPIVNPEGNTLDTRKNANLVDPNRNYDYQWGGPGSGDNPLSFSYRGPSAFSEPEVKANADFARSIIPDVWITMHTGVAEFYWPWGWTHDKSPDYEFFESIEKPFEDATNGRVDAMMAAELYLAAGATDDWGYAILGVPTHTFEVHEDQFVPVYGQGVPAEIEEQLNGLDFVVQNARVWGAWLVFHQNGDTFHIYNEGWAKAVNVTLQYAGQTMVYDEIGPGNMTDDLRVDGPATMTFKRMIIDAPEAKTYTVRFMAEPADVEPVDNAEASAVPMLLVATALLVVAIRRRAR